LLFVTSKHNKLMNTICVCVCVCFLLLCREFEMWRIPMEKKRAKILLQCILYYNKTMMGEATNA
jgi:hypothetical protein